MNAREEGFLLLSSSLGDPQRKVLTTAQLRTLALCVAAMDRLEQDRDLTPADLTAMGYGSKMAEQIVKLLDDTALLKHYLNQGKNAGCVPLTRVSNGYPVTLRRRLGLDSPGVLWAKGDLSILEKPMIALVGSRDIAAANRAFAMQAGAEAARQGYVLVSGNARGSDRIAQEACLAAGGQVVSVVADELARQKNKKNILYISEEGFDEAFSSPRALSRNRIIHALGEKVLVAQCSLGMGGTWSGTVRNLKEGWSPVFCFRDESEAVMQLEQLGACGINPQDLRRIDELQPNTTSFL